MWEYIIPVAVVGGGIMIYNSLVKMRVQVDGAWADIDVQLKRRHDLIPNIVETVKGYAKHEEGVFTKVTEARTMAMQAKTPAEHAQAENMLSSTLKSLFAVFLVFLVLGWVVVDFGVGCLGSIRCRSQSW